MAKTIFYSPAALVRKILFCYSKIKFISLRHHVMFSIYGTPKQRKIKFKPSKKLNQNIYTVNIILSTTKILFFFSKIWIITNNS